MAGVATVSEAQHIMTSQVLPNVPEGLDEDGNYDCRNTRAASYGTTTVMPSSSRNKLLRSYTIRDMTPPGYIEFNGETVLDERIRAGDRVRVVIGKIGFGQEGNVTAVNRELVTVNFPDGVSVVEDGSVEHDVEYDLQFFESELERI
jgi:hypothetical protein